MNFIDWMNMSMAVDIAFLVFSVATVWKFKSLQRKISEMESKTAKNEEKLHLTMRNPAAAKRLLKEL